MKIRSIHERLPVALTFFLAVPLVAKCCCDVTAIANGLQTSSIFSSVPRPHSSLFGQFVYHGDQHSSRRILLSQAAIIASTTSCGVGCNALSPNEARIQYDTYANSYDQLDGGVASTMLGIDEARKLLIQQAHGKVLEIGVGTGLNLPYYAGNDRVTSLDLVDISKGMLQQAKMKAYTIPNLPQKINFVEADITSQLTTVYGYDSFDTVIDTFSMCVLGNDGAQQCLNQIGSVVRAKNDGGQVLLLENSRSSNALLGSYQDMTANLIADTATGGGKGCYYNQNIRQLIQSNPFLNIEEDVEFAAGLFRSFRCVRN